MLNMDIGQKDSQGGYGALKNKSICHGSSSIFVLLAWHSVLWSMSGGDSEREQSYLNNRKDMDAEYALVPYIVKLNQIDV